MKNLGENIRKFRRMRRISQADLAQNVGKSKNVVSNWENGINSPDVETVDKICKLLRVTPNELFGWDVNDEYVMYEATVLMRKEKINDINSQIEELRKAKRELEDELEKVEAFD